MQPLMGDVGRCLPCDGTGKTYIRFITCPTCKGQGLENFISYVDECRTCKGKKCVEDKPAREVPPAVPLTKAAKKKRSK